MDDTRLSAASDAMRPQFLNVRRIFRDIAGEVKRFELGKEIAPGITPISAYGHTPGHTGFVVASGNQSLLVLGDTTNHPWLFERHPQWQGSFDIDGAMAVETRRRMLDRAAADQMLVRLSFPVYLGAIAKRKR
jgi:glyoxylase-like metal-dependent hydrolase (beta-lactamase superfamily II)